MANSSQSDGTDKIFDLSQMSPKDIVFSVFELIADIGNIIGNVIIALLIHGDNKFKSVASRLLVNQAFADGSVGLLYIFGVIYLIAFDPSKTDARVAVTSFRVCLVIFYSESLQTLGATAFSLYMAICHPVKFKIYNNTRIVAVFIVATWLINVAVGCLVLVADAFTNDDLMLFSFYRHDLNDIWYEVLKLVVMFLAPLIGVVCFIKVMIYKRRMSRDEVHSQSNTVQLVRQSLGVMWISTIYVIALLVQIVAENMFPITTDDTKMTPILSFFVYLYLVLKLPLFLVLFKPYRLVARRICCSCILRNTVNPLPELVVSQSRNTGSDILDVDVMRIGYGSSTPDTDRLHKKWTPTSTAVRNADENRENICLEETSM